MRENSMDDLMLINNNNISNYDESGPPSQHMQASGAAPSRV